VTDWDFLLAAAEIADDLDAQRRREDSAFTEGFRIGYQDGYGVGYAHAHKEMAEQWREVAEQVRRTAHRPTYDEVQKRREELPDMPCDRPGCRACSRCIRADAVRRRGGDYMGQQVTRGAA
jgi:hypothetical protein